MPIRTFSPWREVRRCESLRRRATVAARPGRQQADKGLSLERRVRPYNQPVVDMVCGLTEPLRARIAMEWPPGWRHLFFMGSRPDQYTGEG